MDTEKHKDEKLYAMLISEENKFKRGFPNCPRLVDTVDIPKLARSLQIEQVNKIFWQRGFKVIFKLGNYNVSHMTRAIQVSTLYCSIT